MNILFELEQTLEFAMLIGGYIFCAIVFLALVTLRHLAERKHKPAPVHNMQVLKGYIPDNAIPLRPNWRGVLVTR